MFNDNFISPNKFIVKQEYYKEYVNCVRNLQTWDFRY